MPTLWAHAREAGVATAFRALLPRFLSSGWQVRLDFNAIAAAAYGLPTPSAETIAEADLVLCGYDMPERDSTGALLRQAQTQGIPSLAILDAWKGGARFWYGDGSLRPLADAICVPDGAVLRWLAKQGVPVSRLHVIEHPMLASLCAIPQEERAAIRMAARGRLGLSGDDRRVLMFFSEPLVAGSGEFISLAACPLVDCGVPLHRWAERQYGDAHALVMRCHPVEPQQQFSGWCPGNTLSLEESLFVADRVVGVGSTAMIYASACNIPVRNLHELLDWNPQASNYEPEIWQRLFDAGVLGSANETSVKHACMGDVGSVVDVIALAAGLCISK